VARQNMMYYNGGSQPANLQDALMTQQQGGNY